MAGLVLLFAGLLFVLKVNGFVIPLFIWIVTALVYVITVIKNIEGARKAKIDRLLGYRR